MTNTKNKIQTRTAVEAEKPLLIEGGREKMNGINRLISPSLTRSIVYPVLAAGSMYLGTMSPSNEHMHLLTQYKQAINSNSNLVRVLDLEYHIKNSRVRDGINGQLETEKSKLLTNPETKQGYELSKRLDSSSFLPYFRAGIMGGISSTLWLLGAFTILNTLYDRKKQIK